MELTSVYGQETDITGVICDSDSKKPIGGVIIRLHSSNGEVVSYTISKDDGKFSLPYYIDGIIISLKNMGYREHMISVSDKEFPLNILLIKEPILLRDVVIKAPDILIRSDTLIYNVQKYTDAQDRTIADVLKKMPGIEVTEKGEIKYNGTPINKFYIEGNDLLEGRYGLATNNISHNDVQNVEVFENHQPIRALQGIDYSEQAGLNLRLKESAKLRWSGVMNGGLGFSPLIYDTSLFAMRIAGRNQSMETARINNNGWNPASQSANYTTDNLFGTIIRQNQLQDYIKVGEYSIPIEENLVRFNQSFLFNTTNSLKLKNDYDLKIGITYEKDNLDFIRSSYTDYFDNSISTLTEIDNLLTQTQAISGQLVLQSNKPDIYLKNNLHTNFQQNEATSAISGSYEVGQYAEKPIFNITNELQAVKRIKNRILTISSSNKLVNKPNSLLVETDKNKYFQRVTASAFQSVTELSYGWSYGQWQIRGRVGMDYNFNKLESNLTGLEISGFSSINNSQLSVLNLYILPDIVYEDKRIRFNPYVLINYYGYFFNDKNLESSGTKSYGFICPSILIRYKFTPKLELLTDIRYNMTPPKVDIFYRGEIMNNYRYLKTGYPSYSINTGGTIMISFRYRNPISSVFANAGFKYDKYKYSLSEEQLFINDQILMTYQQTPNSSDIYRLNGGISKGFFFGKINIGMDMGYAQLKTATIRNSTLVPYKTKSISVLPKIKGTISKFISVEYLLTATKNSIDLKDNYYGSSYTNLNQKLNISLFPIKKIQAYTNMIHYHMKFRDNTADDLILFDIGTRWMVSDIVNINLIVTNLLNNSNYHYSQYGMLNEVVHHYRIRPRNALMSVQIKI